MRLLSLGLNAARYSSPARVTIQIMLMEALDSRRLLASAPPTVLGISAHVTVTSGSAPLATSGDFTLEVGTNARNYKIVGGNGIADSEGTYAYRIVKPKVGE